MTRAGQPRAGPAGCQIENIASLIARMPVDPNLSQITSNGISGAPQGRACPCEGDLAGASVVKQRYACFAPLQIALGFEL